MRLQVDDKYREFQVALCRTPSTTSEVKGDGGEGSIIKRPFQNIQRASYTASENVCESANQGKKSIERKDTDSDIVQSVAQAPMVCSGGDLPSGCKLVLGNKNNNGKMFIDDGQPFWTEQRKPTDADL
ncbi:hypothetical protein COOONC_24413, partial [Cooperia oncophora]